MRRATFAFATLAWLALGCDAAEQVWAVAQKAPAAAERPDGWESLESEAEAVRLYYQFVDATRRVRFVERLEDVPEALRESVGFVKMAVPPPLSPGDAARARRAQGTGRSGSDAAPAALASAGVVLYSAEWCGACRKAKRHLKRRGVDFEERDIDEPRHAEDLLRRTGSRAIPVLDVNGRVVTGFSAGSYDALIDRA